MWRMVGCGFLPTSKTDPWNIYGRHRPHWRGGFSAIAIIVKSVSDFLPIYTAAQLTAISVAKTNCTSTFCAEAESEGKYFSWKCVLFVLYSIINCDLCQLWLFCHFVSEAMQTLTLHIFTWLSSYRYLIYIIVLFVHPPLLFKQGRLHEFPWKLSLIWFCPKCQNKNSFYQNYIDLTWLDYYVFELTRNFICTNIFANKEKSQSKNLAGAIIVSHLNRPGVQNINVSVCRRWINEENQVIEAEN